MALSGTQSQHRRFSSPSTLQAGGLYGTCSSMRNRDYMGNPSPLRAFTLPLIYPGDPVNDNVLDFRDRARGLLRSGASLCSIMGSGATDVELLFRAKQPDDEWNVPGWACEVGFTQFPQAPLPWPMIYIWELSLVGLDDVRP